MFGVQGVDARDSRERAWIVRWEVDGKSLSRSFQTKALAERYRSELNVAHSNVASAFDRRPASRSSWAPCAR